MPAVGKDGLCYSNQAIIEMDSIKLFCYNCMILFIKIIILSGTHGGWDQSNQVADCILNK
ncbi:hypothetical protein GCM10011450_18320 [Advenella faeciporci]|uniref:Uncharacterized protein n=1 Tax=Advenella faeciporci TaxID=797535 RepID=A0A918JLS6_9BURK|nr:hypothetical protein GCM10011450_18320 [Advenella faeciporci]